MDAEGELMGSGATTILSLRDNDVVTIGPGRTSTSGTLVIEAQPNVDRCGHLPDQPGARYQRHGCISGRLAERQSRLRRQPRLGKEGLRPFFSFWGRRSLSKQARCAVLAEDARAPFRRSQAVQADPRRWRGTHRSALAGGGATCLPGCGKRTSLSQAPVSGQKGYVEKMEDDLRIAGSGRRRGPRSAPPGSGPRRRARAGRRSPR